MRKRFLGILLIFAFAPATVKADIAPLPPQPPPPSGPEKAVIRGIGVQRVYTYWRGRRWITVIDSCASSQAACSGRELSGCFVTGVDGRSIEGGDIALLMAVEKSAGAAPIKLTLEKCSPNEIELKP